ncbi:MAG: hypothetical protein KAT34_15030 [Candidatus Aminicenantes bacterium]|nr:hypothetical protein [Candidatus Aminicenantes bacterium]
MKKTPEPESLFECNAAENSDIGYKDIIENKDEEDEKKLISYINDLWKMYHPYADKDFHQQFQKDIHSRFWEMNLTCTFIEKSLPVKKKNKDEGPDILLEGKDFRIWVEAIAPTSGDKNNIDRVHGFVNGKATRIPNDKIILRYTQSIVDKSEKLNRYLSNEVALPSDAYVIAINSCKIEWAIVTSKPPLILKALFPIGDRSLSINNETKQIIDKGYSCRPTVERETGTRISTDLFMNRKYENISGILFSRVGVFGLPSRVSFFDHRTLGECYSNL